MASFYLKLFLVFFFARDDNDERGLKLEKLGQRYQVLMLIAFKNSQKNYFGQCSLMKYVCYRIISLMKHFFFG